MKLGLKEIGAVAALATAGCAMDKPTTAISRRQYVDFPDTITEKMIEDIRTRCNQEAHAVASRLTSGWMGFGSMINPPTAEEIEKDCLALHGLTLEGDITDTMPTDQSFESDIKADGRRRGRSTFKIGGAEFGGGGLTCEI